MSISKENLNNFLPNGFETENKEDYKKPFDEDLVQTGYERDVPDIVSGPNLNNLIDVVGKNTNTLNKYVNYLNEMPINSIPITDSNNNLNYIDNNFLNKNQITNCILEAPNGVAEVVNNGNAIRAKEGLKVLCPDGKNTDGTLKNYEYTVNYEDGDFTDSNPNANTAYGLFVIPDIGDCDRCQSRSIYIQETEPNHDQLILSDNPWWYKPSENQWYKIQANVLPFVKYKACFIGFYFSNENQIITNISSIKNPISLATKDEIDGNWVVNNIILLKNKNFAAETKQTFDLSEYLPNDGNRYEIIGRFVGRTGTTSGNRVNFGVLTKEFPAFLSICSGITRTSQYVPVSGNFTILIGADRQITLENGLGSSGTGFCDSFDIRAYRKVR